MLNPGDVVLAQVPFTDTNELKKRPALILFQEHSNVIIAGITSNLSMKGIPLSKSEGIRVDSIIKLNYIFTISNSRISRLLFHLNKQKKKIVFDELVSRLQQLVK